MRITALAALGVALGLGLTQPASAQSLKDVGRVLQDQVLGPRADPERERDAYERGRQDQDRVRAEEQRRREEVRRDEFRRQQDARRGRDDRGDDRRRWDEPQRGPRDYDRQRMEQDRGWSDDHRPRDPNGRY